MAYAALYAFTAFSIGRVHELFGFLASLHPVLLIGGASIFLALFTPAHRRHPVLAQREVRLVLALAALAIWWTPSSVWPTGSLAFIIGTYSKLLVFVMLIVALATSPRVVRNLIWSVLVGVSLLGIFTIGGTSFMSAREYTLARAYASATYDPNDVAMIMVCALPLAVGAMLAHRGLARAPAAAMTMICVLATMMTVSRGGFVGLAFVGMLLLFRVGTASLGTRVVALAAMVILLAATAPPSYWDVMSTIWSPSAAEAGYVARGVYSRMELWQRGIDMFLNNAFTGVGIGMYDNADGLIYGRQGGWVTAHNSFLQVAVELGVGGLALFLALLIISVRNARLVQRLTLDDGGPQSLHWMALATELSLYAYMVVGFALSQAYAWMLYFLVGLAAAMRAQVEAQVEAQPETHASFFQKPIEECAR